MYIFSLEVYFRANIIRLTRKAAIDGEKFLGIPERIHRKDYKKVSSVEE